MKKPEVDLSKLCRSDQRTVLMLMECSELLYDTVSDVMPQIGRIVIQDYANLNRGLMLAESLFGRRESDLRKIHKSKQPGG
jgi:hypothetical protein